ncbi:MAG: aminodeoxychorismate synthase, component I [Dehalococcoidia bacterium]|nr:aminodeoxychorismate synthase, component I [Dehalococcoidia bacterium]
MATSQVRTRRPHAGASVVGNAAPAAQRGAAQDDELDQLLASIGLMFPTGVVSPVAGPVSLSPYQAAARLLDWRQLVLLDHSSSGTTTGRYSYVSADPFLVLRSRSRRCELAGPDGSVTIATDPLILLDRLLQRYAVPRQPELPALVGGAIGYFGYDLGRLFERWPAIASDEGVPDLHVGFYDWVLAADHHTGQQWLISTGLPRGSEPDARARWHELQACLVQTRPPPPANGTPAKVRLRSNVGRDTHLAKVRRAKEYIAAGDIYQVNLSHRLEGEWAGPCWPLYEHLRAASPVPYGAYLALDDCTVLSASPERFLRFDGRNVETRPIKGTLPRGTTASQDHALSLQLARSGKDRAENLMIVDLLRNDLGKVCQVGTIQVPELFGLEGYASVWHLVSTVRGTLRSDLTAVDLLRACFPGGSVTGCPKIRAMEIIEELEPVRRGVYCGAIGYLSFTGDMDTSITIRTLVARDRRIYLQVGGAVVADSDPQAEYLETLAKGQAVVRAIGAGLDEW